MQPNIIKWLNENFDAGDVLVYGLIAFIVWFTFWKLVLGRILYKCDCNSLGYALFELGAGGIFGIFLFLLILVILFIVSFQAVIVYGFKMIFPLLFFWGIVIAFFVFVIRYLIKKE